MASHLHDAFHDPHDTIIEEDDHYVTLHAPSSRPPSRLLSPSKRFNYLFQPVNTPVATPSLYPVDLLPQAAKPDSASLMSLHSSHQSHHLLDWTQLMDMNEFTNPDVLRAAIIEFVSTMLYTYISFSSSITALNLGLRLEVVAVLHVFLIALFIMATGSATGGHFNPNITFVMLFGRMISLGRGVLYVIAQSAGAMLAGFFLRVASNNSALLDQVRCSYADNVGVGAVLVNEFVANSVFLFITLYLALDARQQKAHGNLAGPLLVGVVVGVMIVGNASVQKGMAVSMNSARCLGGDVAALDFGGLWAYWVGGLVASLFTTLVYNLIPPHHTILYHP